MEEHIHQWKPYLPDAPGESDLPHRGRVLICNDQPCSHILFLPHNKPQTVIESTMIEGMAA